MVQWLNDLRYARFNSAVARRILGLIYRENQVYPILWGATRGMKMRFHPTMTYHAIVGLYEKESTEAITAIIKALRGIYPHTPLAVADVGANLGVYTLLLAKLVRSTEHVYAFEPSPDVAGKLRDNVDLNHLEYVTVVEKAVSDQQGTLTFYLGHDHHTGSLLAERASEEAHAHRSVTVQSTTLDNYFATSGLPYPQFIKMDIEGGAVFALKGCDEMVAKSRPVFYIESHSPEEDLAIGTFAHHHQYEVYRLSGHCWVTDLTKTHPHPDGLWGNLLLFPTEQSAVFHTIFV